MVGIEALLGGEVASGPSAAAIVVGLVLVEALLLYVGYGTLERLLGPAITKALRGE
jgi:hypothetical protein